MHHRADAFWQSLVTKLSMYLLLMLRAEELHVLIILII